MAAQDDKKPSHDELVTQVRQLSTVDGLRRLVPFAHPESWFQPGKTIHVEDKMQVSYTYKLTKRYGRDFDPNFRPELTPRQMLSLGVFDGKYLNDCVLEFPREWFKDALDRDKLRPGDPDEDVNLLEISSRKSLQYWREKGWIPIVKGDEDVRGWFQWYCRYYIGRRGPSDEKQIKRWKAFKRHRGAIAASIQKMEEDERPRTQAQKRQHRARQRQALLQWAYDPWDP
eukprot:GABV01001491.1.p1 GENE.GABV01001491.1~~GABV01001491.1.p1  ORF type:complete len:228 (+),score=82.10 GABV01001491.1:128-811(+)